MPGGHWPGLSALYTTCSGALVFQSTNMCRRDVKGELTEGRGLEQEQDLVFLEKNQQQKKITGIFAHV